MHCTLQLHTPFDLNITPYPANLEAINLGPEALTIQEAKQISDLVLVNSCKNGVPRNSSHSQQVWR